MLFREDGKGGIEGNTGSPVLSSSPLSFVGRMPIALAAISLSLSRSLSSSFGGRISMRSGSAEVDAEGLGAVVFVKREEATLSNDARLLVADLNDGAYVEDALPAVKGRPSRRLICALSGRWRPFYFRDQLSTPSLTIKIGSDHHQQYRFQLAPAVAVSNITPKQLTITSVLSKRIFYIRTVLSRFQIRKAQKRSWPVLLGPEQQRSIHHQ